jgi:hypothetical protein
MNVRMKKQITCQKLFLRRFANEFVGLIMFKENISTKIGRKLQIYAPILST